MPDAGPNSSDALRVTVFLLVLVGLLVGGLWVVVSDSSGDRTCRDPVDDIAAERALDVPANGSTVNATVERVGPEAIRYTYGNLTALPDDFGPAVPAWLQSLGVRIQSAKGFAVYRSEERTRLVRNATVPDPQVTVRTVPSPERGGLDSAGAAITPEWAFLPLLPHGVPTNVTLAPGQPGVVGDQVLLLGEHRTVRRAVDCHEIVLHVPTAVDATEDLDAVADSLAEAGEHLDFGWRYETVRVFGVGDPIRPGGRAFTHEVWVHAGTSFEPAPGDSARYPPSPSTANVWLHEYLHTLQAPLRTATASPERRWLTEAVPAYYAVAETERQDRLDPCTASAYWARLNRSLHLGPGTVNLSEPRTYLQTDGHYTRGAYVLAALDAEVRARTGGLRSLQHALRLTGENGMASTGMASTGMASTGMASNGTASNGTASNGTAANGTRTAFRTSLRETAGSGLEPWLDRYVAGTSIPPPPPRPLQCIQPLDSPTSLQFVMLVAVLGVAAVLAGRLLGAVLFG